MEKYGNISGKLLAAFRCVFNIPFDMPINEDEWNGDDDSGGVKHYIESLVRDEVKKAYKAGYCKAYTNYVECLDEDTFVDGALFEAERNFVEWEK